MIDSSWLRPYSNKGLYVSNQILATSNITAYYSDERLKDIVEHIDPDEALKHVCKWKKVRYTANALAAELADYDVNKLEIGLLAGEIQEDYPELTPRAPFDMAVGEFDGIETSKSGEEYKTLTYERITVIQAAAIEALSRRLDALEGKL